MINNNRIVPITKIDWLSAVSTFLNLASVSHNVLASSDVQGTFSVTGSGSAGTFLCDQPVKKLNIPSGVTGCTIYFVAAVDFLGLTVNDAAPTFDSDHLDNDDIVTDAATLYKAVLSSGTVTLTAVTPVTA